KTQPQISSQLEILQEQNKSSVVAKKVDSVKSKVDRLIQQIRGSSSQTQADTIKTAKQQN
ncbi:MAG: hypothetical protein ACYSSL_04700, partial [Planctomycetota bacterium]